jgi:antitoxin VapB
MSLKITNPNTERLARQVAQETGESVPRAIHQALEERWTKLQAQRRRELDELLRRVDAMHTLNDNSTDEIPGHDERGIPHA